jgi:hypothetical protein
MKSQSLSPAQEIHLLAGLLEVGGQYPLITVDDLTQRAEPGGL